MRSSDQEQASLDPQPILPPEDGRAAPVARPVESWPVEDVLPAEPPPPRVWTVFAILVSAFVANAVAGAVVLVGVGVISRRGVPRSDNVLEEVARTPGAMLWMLVASMIVLGVVGLTGAWASPVPWRERVRLTAPCMSVGQIASAALGCMAIGFVFSMLYALGLLPQSSTIEALGEAMSEGLGEGLLTAILVVGIMPGIMEELLFRGYVQTRLSQRWGSGVAIFVTALLFGAYHLDFSQGMFAFVLGIFLGAVVERAGSIIPAVVGHAANNSFSVVLSNLGWEPHSPLLCTALLIVAAIVLAICTAKLGRGFKDVRLDPPDSAPPPPNPEACAITSLHERSSDG